MGLGWASPTFLVGFADFAGVFQHEHGAGAHLLRDPLVQDVNLSDHPSPPQKMALLVYETRRARNRRAPESERTVFLSREPAVRRFFAASGWGCNSARICRTVSLRQMVNIGWREFFRMSITCCGEVSRNRRLPSVSRW